MHDAPDATVPERWSDARLDAARLMGDGPADAAIDAVAAAGQIAAVSHLLESLVTNDQPVPAQLPAVVQDYLRATSALATCAPEDADRGARVFAEHGPEIMMLLCCSSLPSAYAARKGVQVLHRTSYLAKRPNRRLFETAQMIVDVLSPGGLGPDGRGVRTAQKVRLMHAAIRHLILTGSEPWPTDTLGTPINQEDLLGTLMTFSSLILDGLRQLGAALSPEDEAAYLRLWLHLGRLMGIDPALLPGSVDEARALTAIIERRQVAPSPEGREMMAALLGMMTENMPFHVRAVPAGLVREFLPASVADFLGVPDHPLELALADLADRVARPLALLADDAARRRALVRRVSVHLLDTLVNAELDGRRTAFAIPETLTSAWAAAPADSEESWWEKFVR